MFALPIFRRFVLDLDRRALKSWTLAVAATIAAGLGFAAPVRADPAALPDDQRLVSVPGRRALVVGYPEAGLEVWAYPLQVLNGYKLRFREAGRVQPFEGQALLRRVETRPTETVRVYVGPDFVVRERLFTAPQGPEVFVDFAVEGRADAVQIEARFKPSLDLMWPGALGGQSVNWDAGKLAYVEHEPLHDFSAAISSPETVAHDDPVNTTRDRDEDLALVLKPRIGADRIGTARIVVTADLPDDTVAATRADAGGVDALRGRAEAADAATAADSVRLITPDPAFDRAFADAERALDQAWVCAPKIGCGEVAGYGPSRPGRRPQYAWFFAGDGLVATDGLLAAGRYARAREELAFVTRFQDRANGMIWHEMSLSAPYIDWAHYPYMYVHVDITLQYLAEFARYVSTTGDRAFLTANWGQVEAAWRYARSLIDPATGLPQIPPGKEGQNEQAQLKDDVRLSSAWIEGADGFAALADAAEHTADANDARQLTARARRQVAAGGWDPAHGFWIEGHTRDGRAVVEARADAVGLLSQNIFARPQVETALDRLASPAFRTDWGERSLAADAPGYDPNAYALGAVWGLGTEAAAETFWRAHRPLVAWSLLKGLSAWNTLDKPGGLHEVLAGDLYHPEIESTPVQTWSSAALVKGAVNGLLGLKIDGAAARVAFAPHLPGDWPFARIEGVRVGASHLDLSLNEGADALTLDVTNAGHPVTLDFAPELPLGAKLLSVDIDGRPVPAAAQTDGQDQPARVTLVAPPGETRLTIRYAGGMRLAAETTPPTLGEPSRNVQIERAAWNDGRLDIDAEVADPAHTTLDLSTRLRPTTVTGATIASGARPGCYRLTLVAARPSYDRYVAVHVAVGFAPPQGVKSFTRQEDQGCIPSTGT